MANQDVMQRVNEESRRVVRPAVDIYEDATGITLYADLPGVTADRLTVQAERENLLIEGELVVDLPKDMEALYADVRGTHYRRSFTLSKELQADKIQARLRDGVLTLHIPKREEVRPRKVTVQVD